MIEQALAYIVTHNDAITSIIANRVYPNAAAGDTSHGQAYVTYQLVSAQHASSYTGSSGLNQAFIQLSLHSQQYAQVKTLAEATRLALNNWADGQPDNFTPPPSQPLADQLASIQGIDIQNEQDLYLDAIDGSEIGYHVVHFDLAIFHNEPN